LSVCPTAIAPRPPLGLRPFSNLPRMPVLFSDAPPMVVVSLRLLTLPLSFFAHNSFLHQRGVRGYSTPALFFHLDFAGFYEGFFPSCCLSEGSLGSRFLPVSRSIPPLGVSAGVVLRRLPFFFEEGFGFGVSSGAPLLLDKPASWGACH